jgi:hypothetical protein
MAPREAIARMRQLDGKLDLACLEALETLVAHGGMASELGAEP